MSVEFEIKIPRRSGDVSKLLAGWIESETFEENPWVEVDEDQVTAFVFQPGESLRGWTLKRRSGGMKAKLDLRLNVCASPGDWRLACSFLRYALRLKGQVVGEGRAKVTAEEVTDAEAENRGWKEWQAGVTALRGILHQGDEDHLALPTWIVTTSVDREDIPDRELSETELRQLHDSLIAKADRYVVAHRATVMQLGNGSTLLAWAGIGTLVNPADFVVFPLDPDHPNEGEHRFLPWSTALEVLGGYVEIIRGEHPAFYFPAINLQEASDREIWQKLVAQGRPSEELTT